MSIHLQTGHFFGQSSLRFTGANVTLSELAYRAVRKLPRHSHESAYVSLLMYGQYRDRLTGRLVEYAPFQAGFRPALTEHTDEYGEGVNLFFNVEIRARFLETLIVEDVPSVVPPMLCGARTAIFACGLYHNFLKETFSELAAESVVAEMMGDICGMRQVEERTTPRWLVRAIDYLHANCSRNLSLIEVAREAGVHPVHLSRVFRARFDTTMGALINHLRVQRACRILSKDENSLCDIASDCGFSDQSHFSRVFKAMLGITPARFRHHHAELRRS
jgi:AraC family transcriptional regulator